MAVPTRPQCTYAHAARHSFTAAWRAAMSPDCRAQDTSRLTSIRVVVVDAPVIEATLVIDKAFQPKGPADVLCATTDRHRGIYVLT